MRGVLMGLDPFFRKPIRTAKGGGTKCTSCEIVDDCTDAGKCILPLICATVDVYGLTDCASPAFINADPATGAIYYDCQLHGFDLSIQCDVDIIDFLLTYEIHYDVQYAVLRSYYLGLEEMVPFSSYSDARCPTFDFGVIATSPYPMVALGQQMCIDSGPDDCTAGRCLPRHLCTDIYTTEQPDIPFKTVLSWYTNDTVTVNDVCCCNANVFPEILIARVVNFSAGCACIAPQRFGSIFFPIEHAGAELQDPGALLHMRHKIAAAGDLFVDGYPFVTEGSNIWVSEGSLVDDLVLLCPVSQFQAINGNTRQLYGRMILWCDAYDGQFKSAFETVDYTGSVAAANSDYQIPYNEYNPFSTVTVMDSVDILACNPFAVRCRGIYEDINCQDLSSADGYGELEIVVNEFQGWIGDDPVNTGGKIIVYTERVNVASAAQTLATDCYLKLHFRNPGEETFKSRGDLYYIDKPWPNPVWDSCTFPLNEFVGYSFITTIDIYPQSCTGCELVVDDPYGPVVTPCCDVALPRTLYVTSVETFDCPCADGTVFELNYSTASASWIGEGVFGSGGGCGVCTVQFELICRRTTGGHTWYFTVSFNDMFFQTYSPSDLSNKSFTCDPFLWETRDESNNSCCNPSFAASMFYWVISL
jgi:hypothetical protein